MFPSPMTYTPSSMKILILSTFTFFFLPLSAQRITPLKQFKLKKQEVPPANYSGIWRVSDDTYALVSDQEAEDGFFLMDIQIDRKSGKVIEARRTSYHSTPAKTKDKLGKSERDLEGIAYSQHSGTFFLGGEGDEEILEYDASGVPTGRGLKMPICFSTNNIRPNLGIESLSYNPETHLFWTTTESTLKSDGPSADINHANVRNRLRLQSFGDDLNPQTQYAYMMEVPMCSSSAKKIGFLLHGVSDICALDDGRLIVMEREIYSSKKKLNNYVNIRLFVVNPQLSRPVDSATPLPQLTDDMFMQKEEICHFRTKATISRMNLANYEGMCLGPRLLDGRQTLLLINDTQEGMTRHGIRLKEYIKVLILESE